MRAIFVICEGPHDVQACARLLQQSTWKNIEKLTVECLPTMLKQFFQSQLSNIEFDKFRLDRQIHPLLPSVFFKQGDDCLLIFQTGGKDNHNKTGKWLEDIQKYLFIQDRPFPEPVAISLLFVQDADERGIIETARIFSDQYQNYLPKQEAETIFEAGKWYDHQSFRTSLFVWHAPNCEKGSLEDCLLPAFERANPELFKALGDTFNQYFQAKAAKEDQLAWEIKKAKGLLTACGQMEAKIAGYALSVVVRDSNLLHNAFDLTDPASQEAQLLMLISNALPGG